MLNLEEIFDEKQSSQNLTLRPAVSASSGTCVIESEPLGEGPSNLCLTHPPGYSDVHHI
jgi:hypothetical protein